MSLYPSFIYGQKANQLVGSTVISAGMLEQVDSTVRDAFVANGQGLALDLLPSSLVDLAKAGFAKAAGVALSFTGSTAITLNFNSLVAATGVQVAGVGTFAGSFSTWSHLLIQNIGTGSEPVIVAPAGSNPLTTQLGGTTPTHTLNVGDLLHWYNSSPIAVGASHCQLTFTPSSGGSMLVFIAGT